MLQPSSLLSHPGFLPIAVAPPTFSSRSSCFSFPLPSLFSAIKPFPLAAASNSSSSSSSSSFPTFFPYTYQNHREQQEEPEIPSHQEEDSAIGDCLVFEDGAFEDGDPYDPPSPAPRPEMKIRRRKSAAASEVEPESLVPEKWKEAVEEINLTKKEKRRISHELRFASRMDRRKKSPVPDREEYRAQREMMLARLKPVVLDDPPKFLTDKEAEAAEPPKLEAPPGTRATPRNPWLALKGETLEDITDLFNSGKYVPPNENDDKKPKGEFSRCIAVYPPPYAGTLSLNSSHSFSYPSLPCSMSHFDLVVVLSRQKLFTTDEKILLNKRIPNLGEATSGKWLPLHSLAASGEFFLLDKLLKHNVDINGVDKDGATLLHYAVLTASSETIKILQLYNVDINLADDDGWTPLHLAVQTQRTDIVRLLLIKGADRTLKNRLPVHSPPRWIDAARSLPLFWSRHKNLRANKITEAAACIEMISLSSLTLEKAENAL
ncbi:hypothetical protein ZIOFF_047901 [Zingiber officinale]|uniref:Ankyrin repeat domain-containing protein, chloroplastic n=1 Tax=Zingiber officinale TaxID=94328 RepID=A0A8J5FU25_ZINOF|nr:hypothetical protein ZIOFF_047901 [Zingiber officinale]